MNAGAQRPSSLVCSLWPPSVEWGPPHLEWIVQAPLTQSRSFLKHAQGAVSIATVNPIKLAIKTDHHSCLKRDSIGRVESGLFKQVLGPEALGWRKPRWQVSSGVQLFVFDFHF